MKIFVVFILLAFVAAQATAQSKPDTAKKEIEQNFANQGEQEDYWTRRLFKDEYTTQSFDKFKGRILMIGKDSIKYDHAILEVRVPQAALRTIFEKGIMYPDIIKNFGYRRVGEKVRSVKLDTTKREPLTDEQINKLQTYVVNNLEEVPSLSNSPHIKRFRFWLFNKLMLNPEVCFIELTNDSATANISLADFITGSKLTFFLHGWTII